ncbi:hypothetical protein G9A89_006842 [Geosiphon pyriformis]|nr:hypothetical protein G9A89_006842 [Geosiphon pyriformis]
MNGSLSNLGSVNMKAGAAVFFEDIGMSLGVEVSGLMSSTLTELQAIALALEYVPSSCSINLFLNSQAALDACKLELNLVHPDFRNWCWIEHRHINLPYSINKCYLRVDGAAISEIGSGLWVVVDSLHADIDWIKSSLMYFMKTLHFRLSVAMHKWLYNKSYFSVMCLFCGNVEVSDHVFFCLFDADNCACLLNSHVSAWELLFTCSSDVLVSTTLYKGFVFKNWFHKSVFVFKNSKVVSQNIVVFVYEFSHAFWEDIWLVYAKHYAFIEKNGLILHNGSVPISISGLFSVLSADMIGLLGITETIGIGFSFHKSCLFFSDIGNKVSVHIDV